LFEEAVAQAAKDAGMRAVVGEVLYDFPSPNYGPIEKGFEYTLALAEKWANDPLIRIAVEPHSPYLCAPELLEKAAAITAAHDLLLVIHLSETVTEVEEIKKKYGLTPTAHLAQLNLLSPTLLACHCVVLTDSDIDLLKRFDVKIAHNAESNMKLASGIAPLPELMQAGICVGIGTDGCASNNNLDMFLEMDSAAKLQKVKTGDPTVLDAATTLKTATIKAAKAIGLDRKIGSLEIGKAADLIIIDTDQPHLVPMYHPVSHIVYAVKGADVTDVMVAGKFLVRRRKLLTLDVEEIMYRANVFGKTFNTQRRKNNGPPSNH